MQKSVREIIEIINAGELKYNQSTQRKFVYAGMPAQMAWGTTTKSGSLINAILEDGIQLPAVYFWHNTDTGHTNIHDGKQRILSLYYFIQPTAAIQITTFRNGRSTNFAGLSEEDQNYLLNYTLDIVERTGDSKQEEKSFYLLNTNSVNLTSYECLSGMYHGTWLTEFETYIDTMSRHYDMIKEIGRGEQAYKFLFSIFNLPNPKRKEDVCNPDNNLNQAIKAVRNNSFDASSYSFDRIIIAFNEIMRAVKGLKEERALAIANMIVRRSYNVDEIVDFYRASMRQVNDITSWDMETHTTFIEKFVEGVHLDPKRMFTKDVKDVLYARSPRCAHIDENGQRCTETAYGKLEVDHIVPWSNGGHTTLDNAQLLCKSHNAGKGNRV